MFGKPSSCGSSILTFDWNDANQKDQSEVFFEWPTPHTSPNGVSSRIEQLMLLDSAVDGSTKGILNECATENRVFLVNIGFILKRLASTNTGNVQHEAVGSSRV